MSLRSKQHRIWHSPLAWEPCFWSSGDLLRLAGCSNCSVPCISSSTTPTGRTNDVDNHNRHYSAALSSPLNWDLCRGQGVWNHCSSLFLSVRLCAVFNAQSCLWYPRHALGTVQYSGDAIQLWVPSLAFDRKCLGCCQTKALNFLIDDLVKTEIHATALSSVSSGDSLSTRLERLYLAPRSARECWTALTIVLSCQVRMFLASNLEIMLYLQEDMRACMKMWAAILLSYDYASV